MAEISAFIGLLQSVKTTQDIMSSILGLRISAEISGKIAQVNKQLIEMTERVMSAQRENAALVARIRQLEEEAMQAKRQQSDLENYQMKQVGSGAFVYAAKEGHGGGEPPHWLCPKCFSENHKSILQHDPLFSLGGEFFHCPRCKGDLTARKGNFPGTAE